MALQTDAGLGLRFAQLSLVALAARGLQDRRSICCGCRGRGLFALAARQAHGALRGSIIAVKHDDDDLLARATSGIICSVVSYVDAQGTGSSRRDGVSGRKRIVSVAALLM